MSTRRGIRISSHAHHPNGVLISTQQCQSPQRWLPRMPATDAWLTSSTRHRDSAKHGAKHSGQGAAQGTGTETSRPQRGKVITIPSSPLAATPRSTPPRLAQPIAPFHVCARLIGGAPPDVRPSQRVRLARRGVDGGGRGVLPCGVVPCICGVVPCVVARSWCFALSDRGCIECSTLGWLRRPRSRGVGVETILE